ncbi:MAG: hypothetical protein ACR2P4_00400, partial [Gammaproteobacteria bacterium]
MAALLFSIGMLGACGGGGGNSASATVNPPVVVTTAIYSPDIVVANTTPGHTLTLTTGQNAGNRIVIRATIGSVATVLVLASQSFVTPGGNDRIDERGRRHLGTIAVNSNHIVPREPEFLLPLARLSINTLEVPAYIVNFTQTCGRADWESVAGTNQTARHFRIICLGETVNAIRATLSVVTVYKAERQLRPVCWRERNIPYDCAGVNLTGAFLAFPDQNYRRDDGECESAPFYAVGNCQSENAVDVGNFAAFVSGLDGNGYRQFGVRHQWKEEDWNAAAMVSHAKGREFLDTWWGRLRFEHSVFDDAAAFAEYESGITSLRQNGFMFADIPISGGRVG